MTFLETNAAAFLGMLLSASVRVAILGGVLLAAMKLLKASPALRHRGLTFVLAAMLLMPLLQTALPSLHLPVFHLPNAQSTLLQPPQAGASLPRRTANHENDNSALQHGVGSGMVGWQSVLLIVYAVGFLVLTTRLFIGLWAAQKLVRNSQPLNRDSVPTFICQLRLGGTAPLLRQSPLVGVPMVVGTLKPAIILPLDWVRWNPGKLCTVLGHEFSHVQRGDPLLRLLLSINKCLYWFHPLAWQLEKRFQEVAEQLSDESALGLVSDRREYAETLLGFAAVAGRSGRVRWAGIAIANRSLSARIERILTRPETVSYTLPRRVIITLLAGALLTTFSTAAIDLTSAPSSQVAAGAGFNSFEGKWQGSWQDTWRGSQASMSLTLELKAVHNGRISGVVTAGALQPQTAPPKPRLSLGGPPPQIAPPPPPPPATPPSGELLNPRIEDQTLVFAVKGPDDEQVNFRLSLQGPDAGRLKVAAPSHPRVYPEFEMKRLH